jgi:hypothetical protein
MEGDQMGIRGWFAGVSLAIAMAVAGPVAAQDEAAVLKTYADAAASRTLDIHFDNHLRALRA